MSSFIPTTGVAQDDDGHISPKVILAMVGSLLAFVAIVVGFLLVARKSCCAPRPVDANATLPSYHDTQHTHIPATRRSSPIGTLRDFQCPHGLKCGDRGAYRSPRASLESLSPPPPPYPPVAHAPPLSRPRGPTSSILRSASFERPHATVSAPAASTPPAYPLPPSYRYASRGPVGGPAPRYRQS